MRNITLASFRQPLYLPLVDGHGHQGQPELAIDTSMMMMMLMASNDINFGDASIPFLLSAPHRHLTLPRLRLR